MEFSESSDTPAVTDMITDEYDKNFMVHTMDQLRRKLLDVSRRNNLINFKQSDRNKNVIRVVDEVPASLLASLIDGGMSMKPLPDIGEEPADEKTDEFSIALSAGLSTDDEYLEAINDLLGTPEDIELAEIALGLLKDKIRDQLGLVPINRDGPPTNIRAYARSHGFNPDFELPKEEEDDEHRDSKIQTLLMPEELQRRLKGIYATKQLIQNDKGLNTFYACFGFLKWFEAKNSDEENVSPLILLPIEIDRKLTSRGHSYKFSSNGAEPLLNQTLLEKLKSDLGVDLPDFESDFEEDGALNLEHYFQQIEHAISKRRNWVIQRQVSFGFFNYLDIVIFNDLLPENWTSDDALLGHQIIARLMGGISANEVGEISDQRDIDSLTLADNIPHLVLPADSSQHSSIIHALEGKPLVIQGPPGTGKSQTITNLIAALATEGKKVLFLAEKQPALDVVKDRLGSVNLGDIVFDPKISGDKAVIYDSLYKRLNLRASFDERKAWTSTEKLKNTIGKTNKYRAVLETETGYCSKRFYELIWLSEGVRSALSRFDLPFYLEDARTHVVESDIDSIEELLQKFFPTLEEAPNQNIDLSGFGKFPNNPILLGVLQEQATSVTSKFHKLESLLDSLLVPDRVQCTSKIVDLMEQVSVLTNEYERPLINYIINEPNAAKESQAALSSVQQIGQLEGRYPFLSQLVAENREQYLSTAYNIDEILKAQTELGSNSLDNLDLILSEGNSCLTEVVGFASALESVNARTLKFSFEDLADLVASFRDDQTDWLRRIELLEEIIPDRITEELAYKLEILLRRVRELDWEIDGLSKSIDFVAVLNRFNADQIQELKDSYDKIGVVGSLFSSSAKRTKSMINSLGLDSGDKEVVNRNLSRLVMCIRKSKELASSPDIGLNFKDPNFNILNKADFLQNLIKAINSLLVFKKKLPQNLQSNFQLSEISELLEFFRSQQTSIESIQDLVDEEYYRKEIGQFEAYFTADLDLIGQLKAECLTFGLAPDLPISNAYSISFTQTVQMYFEEKEKIKQSPAFSSSPDELKKALSVCEVIQNCVTKFGIQRSWLISLLDEDKHTVVDTVLADFHSIEEEMRNFGSEFEHIIYSSYELAEDINTLNQHKTFFHSIANAETKDLIESGKRKSVFEEVAKSFDPAFFSLVGEIKAGQNNFEIEDAKNLFALRTSQSVLRKTLSSEEIEIPTSVEQLLGGVGDKFSELDEIISECAADLALEKVCGNFVPRGIDVGPKRNWTELALIKNEIGKRRSKAPVRRLVRDAGKALLALKPVWFLNPVAASQFLPRESGLFDVVIIDEASQMLPEKAIAAIARCNNLVVVGDNQQMPPTNWLKSSIEFEEEEEEVDAESILDLAQQRVGNTVSLKWHYRSRHPDLIRFSNSKFYDDKLEVFPTPSSGKSNLGVRCVKIDGIYKGQINQLEIQEVLIQARELMERYPDETIGIVAINRPQMERIREALENSNDEIIRDYLERWDGHVLGDLFVKNLDNVQGDERDNIIISTVYGPETAGARVMQRFASVVSMHGHRRLNVLVTRAKNRVILVTSLNPSDVSVEANSPRGKKVFRDYIEYTMTGKLDTGELLNLEADSDFEISVGKMIEASGYKVVPQVGVKGFRIDLGVTHPDYPHGFIAGVECDGATFHSSASARDRDSIRQEILESLGWNIYRVWSTDWFSDPQREKEKFFRWLSSIWSPISLEENDNVISMSGKAGEPDLDEDVVSAGPTGQMGLIDINGEEVPYWKPMEGLYELWIENRLIGYTEEQEIEIADANYSFAHRMATRRVSYRSEILVPEKKQEIHDKFEIGLRWVHQIYLSNS